MTELVWSAIRADTIDRFHGQTPRAEDEAPIIDLFEAHPQLVLNAIDETATALDEGKITWAWSILRTRLERGQQAVREATANTGSSKAKAVERAKQWIENAGLHFDREDHVGAELFGDEYARGPLTSFDTPELRAELAAYWQSQRPRGVQAEHDHEAWNAKAKADRHLVLALRSKPTSEDIDFT